MITAKDINTKRFEQAKPGYKPDEVDYFLRELGDQITQMLKDKEEAEGKIAILVESIRKYKADEEDLKEAILSARKQERVAAAEAKDKADSIIADAQANAEKIIAAANVKAKEILGDAYAEAQKDQAELQRVKDEVKNFKSELLEMYREHLALITSIPEDDEETEASDEEAAKELAAAQNDMEATRVIDTSSAAVTD